jgi:hypothetical protein
MRRTAGFKVSNTLLINISFIFIEIFKFYLFIYDNLTINYSAKVVAMSL